MPERKTKTVVSNTTPLITLTSMIDEKFARGFAEIRGLTLSGSLGVLLEAKKKGIISQVRPLIEKMLASRRYLSEKIIFDLLKSTDELDR